jgi:hypothetical protein
MAGVSDEPGLQPRFQECHQFVGAEGYVDDIRVADRQSADRKIIALIQGIDGVVDEYDLEADGGMLGLKFGIQAPDEFRRNGRGAFDLEMTLELQSPTVLRRKNLVEFRHEPPEAGQEPVSGGRQRQPSGGAHEQLHAETIFQLRHSLGDDRRGCAQIARGTRKAAQPHNPDERLDVEQIVDPVLPLRKLIALFVAFCTAAFSVMFFFTRRRSEAPGLLLRTLQILTAFGG